MKISILGAGKMGGWLAAELSENHDVLAFDPSVLSMPAGKRPNLGKTRLAETVAQLGSHQPDMLVNCVPLGMTIEAFESVIPLLPATCTLSDIASVKTGLASWYAACGRPYTSTHPMFGPTYSDASNLKEQNAVVISESSDEGKAFWKAFYQKLGIRVFEDDFDGHDRTVAYSLGTPFASSMVFAACMKRLDAPGTNFRKHMDIAKGLLAEDDRLLSEIMFNPYTIRQLELINSQLAYLTHIIKDRDHESMTGFLEKLRNNLNVGA